MAQQDSEMDIGFWVSMYLLIWSTVATLIKQYKIRI